MVIAGMAGVDAFADVAFGEFGGGLVSEASF